MLTKREAAIISAYTGFLIGKFSDMHEYVDEKIPGITTIGFVLFADQIREKSKDDFINIKVEGE